MDSTRTKDKVIVANAATAEPHFVGQTGVEEQRELRLFQLDFIEAAYTTQQ